MTIQSNLYFWEYTCDLYNWYILPQPFLNCIKKAFLHSEFFRGENCYEYNLIKCNR